MAWTDTAGRWVAKNSPTILTVCGVAGIFVTAIFSGKASIKAADVVRRLDNSVDGTLTKREIVEETWKFYIPTVLVACGTAACIIGTHNIHTHRNAALLSLYSLTEVALSEYKAKVIETIGTNKERKIREEIHQDHLEANPLSKAAVIVTGRGEVMCYEDMTGRYFKCDMETIRKAQNDVNADIIQHMFVSHNEFCGKVGLPQTTLGDQIGWNTENMMDIHFDAKISDDGEPCIVIEYHILPLSDFYKLH